MSYGKKPKHFKNLIHLMWRQKFDFANADVDNCHSNAFLITYGKSKMALAISICCDGFGTFHALEQIIPREWYISQWLACDRRFKQYSCWFMVMHMNYYTCSKSANKFSTSCVRTACLILSIKTTYKLDGNISLVLTTMIQTCCNRIVSN